jgi:hypothetical protein
MPLPKVALALVGVGLVLLVLPDAAHAWTPGTHIYLGETVLANLAVLPAAVGDLLRAYPFDFLYGNIAADSSIAKHYAPLGRHCHYWHVGQEIHDLAESDALRAFGLGYLCHLSADTVAHNYFVPGKHAHQQHRGSGAQLLGDAGRDPSGRRLLQVGWGRDPAGPARPTRTRPDHRPDHLQRAPTAGSSANGAPDRDDELAARTKVARD